MRAFAVIRHPFLFAGITGPEFLRWYFGQEPTKIVRGYLAYLKAFAEIFSFLFLLRTLFAPWRQIRDESEHQGFSLELLGQAFFLNAVSRVIGFLFRMTELLIGMICVALLTLLFGLVYMGWITFPIWFLVGVSYLITALR